jgi:hypothetical protein
MARRKKQLAVDQSEVVSWLLSDFGAGFSSEDWDGHTGLFIKDDKELMASVEDNLLEITVDGERFPYYYQMVEKSTNES